MNTPNAVAVYAEPDISKETLAKVLMDGNLATLTAPQRMEYMLSVCRSLGLNPTTKPFDFLTLQGKVVMYAKRDAAEQLRKVHGVSITIKAREKLDDVYVVTANAKDAKGREDESIGAVPIAGLKGELLANAIMKAETKAKRRVTLSICGLGMLDETEEEGFIAAENAPREKIASVTGEAVKKKPEWSKDQDAERGALRAQIIEHGGEAGDREFLAMNRHMAYDQPSDCLDKMNELARKWADIADQAKQQEATK